MSITLRDIPLMFAYRVLPFAAYVCVSRTVRWKTRLSIWSMFALSVVLAILMRADLSDVLIGGPLALLYFTAVSLALHQAHLRLRRGPITNGVVLALCGAAYVLVPVLAIPSPAIIATVRVGWEAMLSAFSYWIDAAKTRSVSTRADCLFFVLVNPCLVYSDRGRQADNTGKSALPRVMLGVTAWTGQALISQAFQGRFFGITGAALTVFLMTGTALALYSSHSGLASVQIGSPAWWATTYRNDTLTRFWRGAQKIFGVGGTATWAHGCGNMSSCPRPSLSEAREAACACADERQC